MVLLVRFILYIIYICNNTLYIILLISLRITTQSYDVIFLITFRLPCQKILSCHFIYLFIVLYYSIVSN